MELNQDGYPFDQWLRIADRASCYSRMTPEAQAETRAAWLRAEDPQSWRRYGPSSAARVRGALTRSHSSRSGTRDRTEEIEMTCNEDPNKGLLRATLAAMVAATVIRATNAVRKLLGKKES